MRLREVIRDSAHLHDTKVARVWLPSEALKLTTGSNDCGRGSYFMRLDRVTLKASESLGRGYGVVEPETAEGAPNVMSIPESDPLCGAQAYPTGLAAGSGAKDADSWTGNGFEIEAPWDRVLMI